MSNFNTFEKEIKKTVLNYLLNKSELNKDVTVINELTIDSFSRRLDLAVLTNKRIVAYEIKAMLIACTGYQVNWKKYRQYFDKIIVVTTPKHLDNILNLVSDNIEVWEVVEQKITIKKRGKASKVESKANYLDLLRVQDMRKLASAFNIPLGKGGKKEIKNIITDNLNKISYEKLKSFVIDIMSQRFKLTSTNFLENINVGNKVTVNDLDFLSPYSKIKNNDVIVRGSVLEQLK